MAKKKVLMTGRKGRRCLQWGSSSLKRGEGTLRLTEQKKRRRGNHPLLEKPSVGTEKEEKPVRRRQEKEKEPREKELKFLRGKGEAKRVKGVAKGPLWGGKKKKINKKGGAVGEKKN